MSRCEQGIDQGRDPKKGSISQLTKDNAMICAHEFLGDSGGISKLSDKRIDYILVAAGVLPAIIRGGKQPFKKNIALDHKTLFLDLDAEVFFGKSTGKIDIQQVRKLNIKYPKRTEKYVEDVLDKFEKLDLFRKLGDLKKKAYKTKVWTRKMEKKFNTIDSYAMKSILACKKACIPSTYGSFAWSIKLVEIGLRMRYINLLGLQGKKGNIPEDILERARVKAKSEGLSIYSVEDLKFTTIQTREELRKVQEKAVKIRGNELQERAEAYSRREDTNGEGTQNFNRTGTNKRGIQLNSTGVGA